jgi:MOSC domain-containing protein YiiM
MGRTLEPGSFGENLTIAGLESGVFSIGDRLHIGSEVVLEVTCPRIPCATLAARMGDPFFVKRFRAAERPGLYCRVLQEGSVQASDPVTYEAAQVETVTLLEMYRDFFQKDSSEASIRRFLAAPIDIRSRQYLEGRLQAVLAQNQDDPG